ncbi:MAG: cell division protein FtsA [Treponema sp.]|nr:cell division protein FtsA [Treponema sp.]
MIVGLDIGTSVIRVAIGEVDEESGKVTIAGTASRKSAGLRNGVIVNIEDAKSVIRETIEAAELDAGVTVSSVITAIGGTQIDSQNSRGIVAVRSSNGNSREITREDVEKVIESSTAVPVSEDREKLHVIPQDYIVDGYGGISDPIHRIGTRLEAKVHIVTAAKTIISNIRSCLTRAGYTLDGVMLKTLAQTQSVCQDDELDLGSIVIDLGAGTTDALVLLGGAPIGTASIRVGGNLVTNDIAIVAGISVATAENIKIESGCCWGEMITEENDKEVIIPGVGGRPPEVVMQSQICQIIQARMLQIFTMVKTAINKQTHDSMKQLLGNVILTGGGAQMEGVVELAESVFKPLSVRVGKPENLGGIQENYRRPDFATVIGLILANKNLAVRKDRTKRNKRHIDKQNKNEDGFLTKLKKLFF